ncbi:MAG: acetyl-CoA C-acetyltransferase [Bdellovibrionota bacterium]|nr:MAG: acetyl-CoA C-acetyltransferase [Bdellovibrionota bacterium]
MKPIYIVSALRTAIGSLGGSLAHLAPSALGALCAKSVIEHARISAECVDEVLVGNVLGAGHGMNIARQVGRGAGLPDAVPAMTLNRVCGSGLQAIITACHGITAGAYRVVLAGGVESMSQSVHVSKSHRFGSKLGHTELLDLMLQDGLTDAFLGCHMGITAENLASRYGISREAQDRFAVESQQRAQHAIKAGWFKDEIVPVPIEKKGKIVGSFEQDEHPRADTSYEALSALRPAFKKDGSVTAGNASGINDGAAFTLLASEEAVQEYRLQPFARVEASAVAGVDPATMGIGPVPAVQKLLHRAGHALKEYDLIEANEAFAVQALAVSKELGLDASRVNVGGGAIALGHPIGASGARLVVTLLHHLRRTKGARGIATLCVGGGQGVALSVERL